MRNLYLSTFALLCLLCSLAHAQKEGRKISGKITSSDNGESLPGVNIIIEGLSGGTITDVDGNFSLQVPDEANLVISYVGYISQKVEVAGRSVINLALVPEILELQEVVVVGYGEQKKASVVGSISQTDGEDLLKVGGVTTVSEALQGLMPGVTAMNSSSKPGADAANIIIRGKTA
jgi:hypothetical protein